MGILEVLIAGVIILCYIAVPIVAVVLLVYFFGQRRKEKKKEAEKDYSQY